MGIADLHHLLPIKFGHGIVVGADALFGTKIAIRGFLHVHNFFVRNQRLSAALAEIAVFKALFTQEIRSPHQRW